MAADAGTQASGPRPWGSVATLLWVLLALGLSVAISMAVISRWNPGRLDSAPNLLTDGPLLVDVMLVSTAVEIVVLALAARLAGWRVADYLGWSVPDPGMALVSFLCIAAFVVGYDALTYFLSREVVTSFQFDTYRSAREAGRLPMLWLTFVVV